MAVALAEEEACSWVQDGALQREGRMVVEVWNIMDFEGLDHEIVFGNCEEAVAQCYDLAKERMALDDSLGKLSFRKK